MARQLEEFTGIMTYNIINPLKKKPGKYMFVGYIQLNDINGQPSSYKVISFRTHVIYQGQRVGTNALKNKKVMFKGYFKENTWNGSTTFELMAEEMHIEGMERLALEAVEHSSTESTNSPQKPAGSLAPAGATIQQAAVQQPQPQSFPQTPIVQQPPIAPVIPTVSNQQVTTQVIDTTLPQSNPGMVPQPINQTTIQSGQKPQPIAGGFIAPKQY